MFDDAATVNVATRSALPHVALLATNEHFLMKRSQKDYIFHVKKKKQKTKKTLMTHTRLPCHINNVFHALISNELGAQDTPLVDVDDRDVVVVVGAYAC